MAGPTPDQVRDLNDLCRRYLYGTILPMDEAKLKALLDQFKVEPDKPVPYVRCPRCQKMITRGVIWLVGCHTTSGGCGLRP